MLALIFATAKECAAALPGSEPPAPGTWRAASVHGRGLFMAVSGVGPLNAALTLGRLLGAESIRGVVNLGLAGTFDTAALPLESTAVANAEIWPEFGLRSETGVDPQGIGFALAESAGTPVYERIDLSPVEAAGNLDLVLSTDWPQGAALTVSAASGDAPTADSMRRGHAPAMENMEGFALALGCLSAGLPFLEIRTISNLVGSRDRTDWRLHAALDALAPAAATLFSP